MHAPMNKMSGQATFGLDILAGQHVGLSMFIITVTITCLPGSSSHYLSVTARSHSSERQDTEILCSSCPPQTQFFASH